MIKMGYFGYVKQQRKKDRKEFVKRCYWLEKSSGVVRIGAGFLTGGGGNIGDRVNGRALPQRWY